MNIKEFYQNLLRKKKPANQGTNFITKNITSPQTGLLAQMKALPAFLKMQSNPGINNTVANKFWQSKAGDNLTGWQQFPKKEILPELAKIQQGKRINISEFKSPPKFPMEYAMNALFPSVEKRLENKYGPRPKSIDKISTSAANVGMMLTPVGPVLKVLEEGLNIGKDVGYIGASLSNKNTPTRQNMSSWSTRLVPDIAEKQWGDVVADVGGIGETLLSGVMAGKGSSFKQTGYKPMKERIIKVLREYTPRGAAWGASAGAKAQSGDEVNWKQIYTNAGSGALFSTIMGLGFETLTHFMLRKSMSGEYSTARNQLADKLGIDRNAPIEEFKRAYIDFAKRYHPDVISDKSNKTFQEVSSLWDIVGKMDKYNLRYNPNATKYEPTKPLLIGDGTQQNIIPSATSQIQLDNQEVKGGDLGYRAGNIDDIAETYADQLGALRSTGHFGTGTYFFGDEAKAKNYAASDGINKARPVNTIDLKGKNMFKPKNADDGIKLHETLKEFNNLIQGDGFFAPDMIAKDLQDIGIKNITPDDIDNVFKDYVNNTKLLKEGDMWGKARAMDTPSTILMKKLGYDGIDVRGIKELDNGVYGSVLYNQANKVGGVPEGYKKLYHVTTPESAKAIRETGVPEVPSGRGFFAFNNKQYAEEWARISGEKSEIVEVTAKPWNIKNPESRMKTVTQKDGKPLYDVVFSKDDFIPNKPKQIKIKSPETKIAELEQKLKNELDWGKKGKIRAEIEKLRAEIDPTIKARQEEFDKSMELTKQKNYETAKIQKKLTPVNNRLIELNKEVPQALAKSKGSKKGDDSWVKANELVKEKAKLMQEQKELLSQRDDIKVKQPEAKLEPTKVEEPKAVVPVGDIKLPKEDIITSVQKTSSPINKDVNTKIQPLLENIQKIMKDKGLVEKDVVNLRRTGTLEDKELTKVFDNLAEELHSMWKKYADIDIPFRKSYIPDPSIGSSDKIRALVTGGNFIDDVSGIYSPTMRRISGDMELHKTGDLLNAYKANIDSLKYQANKTEIDALLNNLSVKSQQVLAEASKKLGEQIRDTGRGDIDVIKMAKEIAENENIKGPEIVVKRISGFKQKVYDIYNGFDRIGIREPLMNLINYEQNGRALATSLDNSVKNGDIDSVLKEVYKRYPTFDVNSAKDIFTNIQTRTGSIEEPTATLINGLAKKDGIATLLDVLPRLKFEDTDTQKYVNDSLAFILGSDAKTKNVATLFQAKLRKWTTRGMLGLNFSPAIQNITEVRRLFGTSNPKYIAEGIANTSNQLTGGEMSALKKYGFDQDGRYQEKFLETPQGKELVKSLSGKADDLLNNVMILFKGSEQLKDNVYLNAFEAEGKGKGLKGQDLTDYVIHKFRKYSIHGDEWGTLGMFNNGLFGLKGETVKTILQFNQYSMRELGILMDKFTDIKGEPLQALQYITSYALTALVLYQAYEAMGLNGKNAAISLPLGLSNTLDRDKNDFYKKTPVDEILQAFRNISPNTSLVTDLGMFAYEYFANNEEGEDRVAPYLEQRVVKDLFGRFPAGGQIMKTYGVPFMGNQYGGYLQNLKAGYQPNTTGNMRFPVTSETPWEAIKGATFGSASTKYGKEFWKDYKEGMAPATKDFQLDKYKELVSQGKREEAVEYWKKGYENKQRYYTSKNEEYNRLNVQQKAAFDSLPESNPDTPLDDIHKYVTLMQYPEIYNAKKSIAYAVAEGDESLVDPFYTVDYATAKNYMLYKSQPPKSEEAKRIKEAHPEVIALAAARSQFYKDHPIEGQEDTGYDAPIASDYVQKQMDAKNWKDPQVKAFLTAYSDWQNDQREAMGLDRIEYGGGSGYDPMKYFNPTAKKVKISIPKAKKISIKSSTPKKIKLRSLTSRKIAVTPVTNLKKKIRIPKANPRVKLRA